MNRLKQQWIRVTVTMSAQRDGSQHNSKWEREFEMSQEDFDRLSFAEILDDGLHDVIPNAPAWDVPTLDKHGNILPY